MGRLVILFMFVTIFARIGYLIGTEEQKREVDILTRMTEQYEIALKIAGSHYENYVLDVYCESDCYDDSIFQSDYNTYCAAQDSINILADY